MSKSKVDSVCFSFTNYCENLLNNDSRCYLTLCLDPCGDESVRALLLGGGHGGVQLELLRPASHAPAAGLGILPARAQRDELCPVLVQGGDIIYISTVRTVLLYYNYKSIKSTTYVIFVLLSNSCPLQ